MGEVTERKVHKIMSIFINIGRELNWTAITISIIIALLFNLMEHTFLTFAPCTVFFSFLCLFVDDEFIFIKGTWRAGRSEELQEKSPPLAFFLIVYILRVN